MSADVFAQEDGATPLTPEEQLDLIPSLTTRAQLNEFERLNILEARKWAMRPSGLRRDDLLGDGFGRELHRRMFNQTCRWAGQYRRTEKTIGWEVPGIAEGVRNAFEDAKAQLQFESYPRHEVAVRLHRQLVKIHPWPNGNGRHSRLMADVLVAARGGEALTWGAGADPAPEGGIRKRYLAAVRAADQQEFEPLLNFARS
jgi:Fic-DOC domain mobile mystery protein B